MLNYEEFKEKVADEFKDYLPEEFRDMKLQFSKVDKVNETIDGLTLRMDGVAISPTLYVDGMYEEYQNSGAFEAVMEQFADLGVRAFQKGQSMDYQIDYKNLKQNVVFQLVNKDNNQTLLSNIPNREMNDLAVIYRWVIGKTEDGMSSIIVKNDMAQNAGLTEEDLFQLAQENTRRNMPPKIESMEAVVLGIMEKEGMPQEFIDELKSDMEGGLFSEKMEENMMWILTNECGINGAGTMLYDDQLQELSKRLNSNLFILPSSIHEIIAVSTEVYEADSLMEMVQDVNCLKVDVKDRLSNNVYHYDRDKHELTMATDTPHKSLQDRQTFMVQVAKR